MMEEVPISDIVITGWNPRKSFDEKALEELAASIKEHGILEPLVVRQVNGSYELVAGERRLRAAKLAGLDKVPVVVKELSDQEVREIMLLENLQREDLNPIEEALALKALLEEGNITQAELGKRLGKSQAWVANRLRLLEAPEPLKDLVISREISPKHVLTLLPYAGYAVLKEAIMPKIRKKIEEGGTLSVRDVENLIEQEIRYDLNARYVLHLNDFPYELEKYREYFDFTGCDGCKHVVTFKSETWSGEEQEEKYCLNRPCWKNKLNIAKQKYEKDLTAKLEDSVVDTSKLSFSDYEYLDFAQFDQSECEGCENNKKNLAGSSVCLNPECYTAKNKAWIREQNRLRREEEKKALDYLDEKIQHVNFTNEKVLRFILATIVDLASWVEFKKKALKQWNGDINSIPAEDLPKAIVKYVVLCDIDQLYVDLEAVKKTLKKLGVEACQQ